MKITYLNPVRIYLTIVVLICFFSLQSCSIHPLSWNPQTTPAFTDSLSLNDKLKLVERLDLEGWYGPEDITFDSQGNLYCGVHVAKSDFKDGRILRIDSNGKIEVYFDTKSWVSGLHFDEHENLIALSHKHGLVSISKNREMMVLVSQDGKERPFLIPNGLDIASDGMIYFTNTSHESSYNLKYGKKLILENRPQGALYSYNRNSGELKTLIDGTYFGNGVALSQDESYILMTETTKYRILRYWLTGDRKGQTDVFMDNLPGFPNGISIRDNGTYWLGFSTRRNNALDNIHSKPGMKKLVYGLPNVLQPKPELFGMVFNVSQEGKVISAFFDPSGKFVPEAGAVKEHGGHLYIGGDVVSYIAKYNLVGK